jgi:hypothetical protein
LRRSFWAIIADLGERRMLEERFDENGPGRVVAARQR